MIVDSALSLSKIVLMRPGAVTHGFNQDQRYIELNFTVCNCYVIVTAPTAMYAAPGDYLLFALNGDMPSLGKWVTLGPSPTVGNATCPMHVSCSGGGSGGGFFDDGGGLAAERAPGASSAHSTTAALVPGGFKDNTLFAGMADGQFARDRLALRYPPQRLANSLRVRLHHEGPGSDEYSQLRLVAVDHPASLVTADTDSSEVSGTAAAAVSITHENGNDMLPELASIGWVDGQPGDAMVVDLGAESDASGAIWLETSGLAPETGGIRIEVPRNGAWEEAGMVTPRMERSRDVIRGIPGNTVRLVFLGAHHVHGLGRFLSGSAQEIRTTLTPTSITHSALGTVAAGAGFALASADTAFVDFPALAEPTGGTRDWYLEVDGRPFGYLPSAAQLRSRHAPAENDARSPVRFQIVGNTPNPFANSTRIAFDLPRDGDVRLEIFDAQGRRLHRVVQRLSAGRQALDWDRRTDTGSRVGAGVYLVRLSAAGQRTSRSIVVL